MLLHDIYMYVCVYISLVATAYLRHILDFEQLDFE